MKKALCQDILGRPVIKLFGYLLTFFYWTGVFFPAFLPLPTALAGHLAFGLFALLIARGVRRTSNHFLYFVRLLAAAVSSEFILFLCRRYLGLWSFGPNALFTYAASLSLMAGLSMLIGSYRDMVIQAMPAGGEINRKALFGLPVHPGNFRMAPATGLILGFLTLLLSVFVTLYFDFSNGLFGLLFIPAAFLAMDDLPASRQGTRWRAILAGRQEFFRVLLFTAVSGLLSLLWILATAGFDSWSQTFHLLGILAALPAFLLPEFSGHRKNKVIRRLPYAVMPAILLLLFLIRSILF